MPDLAPADTGTAYGHAAGMAIGGCASDLFLSRNGYMQSYEESQGT